MRVRGGVSYESSSRLGTVAPRCLLAPLEGTALWSAETDARKRKSAAQHDVEAVVEADSTLPPTPSARLRVTAPQDRAERPASP